MLDAYDQALDDAVELLVDQALEDLAAGRLADSGLRAAADLVEQRSAHLARFAAGAQRG